MALYQVTLNGGAITAGLEVTDGVVTHAAPVLKKSIGLRIAEVQKWAQKKGGNCVKVSDRSLSYETSRK